jgi:hypothetical protein
MQVRYIHRQHYMNPLKNYCIMFMFMQLMIDVIIPFRQLFQCLDNLDLLLKNQIFLLNCHLN